MMRCTNGHMWGRIKSVSSRGIFNCFLIHFEQHCQIWQKLVDEWTKDRQKDLCNCIGQQNKRLRCNECLMLYKHFDKREDIPEDLSIVDNMNLSSWSDHTHNRISLWICYLGIQLDTLDIEDLDLVPWFLQLFQELLNDLIMLKWLFS